MNHPMLIREEPKTSSLIIAEDKIQKLIERPRPILWKSGGIFYWVPIEKVKNAIRWYNTDGQDNVYPSVGTITFIKGDCVAIPKEAGETIFRYNGHDND